MSTQPRTRLTPEQYLEIERAAEYKSQYYNGEMFAMSGASQQHNTIAGNLFAAMHGQLRGRSCRVYISDFRVCVDATGLYTYPDVVAVCGEHRYFDAKPDTLVNPTFLAEVLSPSTESYDRGWKSEQYRTLESLQEYMIVAQDRMHAELYRRAGDGTWNLSEASRPEGSLAIQSLGCTISLAELYERVELPEWPTPPSISNP